ncbi:hypothetical protein CHS0354_004296 [Potamilus streckersoni]|uniref:Uncharacterized protein n=1 Tax=Potamilus streckersoni TaxID=2493646 RepID=A0AAE0VQ49_9BIVA|nr:hypothetical protein CHS0354_004296 [Potamilus streckersoni]
MEFSDDDSVNKGHIPSHKANPRGGTRVANTRGDKQSNVPDRKSKETGTERKMEKTRHDSDKDEENVENKSDNNVKNLHPEDKYHRNESHIDRLSIVIAIIAVAVALYTLFVSEQNKSVEIGPKDFLKLQKFTDGLSKRLSSVESTLPDIKRFTGRPDDTASIDESLEFENRVNKISADLSGKVNTNNEELKVLKDEVQKLKDQIDVQFGNIKVMHEENKELQAEVIHLKQKCGEPSQFVENRNAEVSNQMFPHNETLRHLNLYVENLTWALSNLNASVENRLITTVSDMLGKINANNMETEDLKDMVQKLEDGLQTNVTTLESKLEELSQSAENKNIEVMKQMSQYSETLKGLNVSAENIGMSLRSLDVSVENLGSNQRSLNVSVENFGSNLRSLNASLKDHGSSLRSLNVSVENLGSSQRSLNVSVEKLGSSLLIQNVFIENLDSNLRNLNVSVESHGYSLSDLNVSVEIHGYSISDLNVSVESHGYSISDLNVSVDSLRSNVKHLTENITGISIETLVLGKRTERIVDNIFDKDGRKNLESSSSQSSFTKEALCR